MESSIQGSEQILDWRVLKGATAIKTLEQVDLNLDRSSSTLASQEKSTIDGITSWIIDKKQSLVVWVIRRERWPQNETEGAAAEHETVNITVLWSENPFSQTSKSVILSPCKSTKSSIWPPLWVGALTPIEKSKAFNKCVNSLAKWSFMQQTWTLKSPSTRSLSYFRVRSQRNSATSVKKFVLTFGGL